MSIAWATVVLVVLLLPGFIFFWGFYAPHQVTRESVPGSPLGQLAGVVIFGFFVHALAYVVINGHGGCGGPRGLPCVDFDQLAALLRIDGSPPPNRPQATLNRMLDQHAGWILLYFGAIALLSFAVGFATGKLVEHGALPLTRHRYLAMLEEGRKGTGPTTTRQRGSDARLVRAHVLSRTRHEELALIYDGVLRDFYSKADGTISYIVLRGARCGAMRIATDQPQRAGATSPLDRGGGGDASSALLVLTSDDIANVYFEHLSTVTRRPDEEKALDEAVWQLQAQQAAADAETPPG